MSQRQRPSQTPYADAFRAWLAGAIEATGLKPATIATGIDASVNSVGAFLSDPSRDIYLSRAADLERYMRRQAKARGIALPAIRRAPAEPEGA